MKFFQLSKELIRKFIEFVGEILLGWFINLFKKKHKKEV